MGEPDDQGQAIQRYQVGFQRSGKGRFFKWALVSAAAGGPSSWHPISCYLFPLRRLSTGGVKYAVPPRHVNYWPILEPHRPASELTDLRICYIQASGPQKEDLNLELLRAFHTYLYKYLDMIVRGHVPRYGANRINEDTRKLLMTMMPKGTPVNLPTLVEACKHLHLAFKGYEPAEM